jgi:mannose-6-phosphate isomerase-like protein (cupin superfamily)
MIVRRRSLKPIDFDGLRIFDYTAGSDLGSSLAYIEVGPGVQHAEAWSKRSDKYYFVVRGEIRFVLDGEAVDLGAGDFCFIAQGRRFSYSNDTDREAVLILVHTPSFELDGEVFVV